MKDKTKTKKPIAPLYCLYLEGIKEVANSHGYAMTLHGSMSTDCDICLVPWTDEVSNGIQVIEAICDEWNIKPFDQDPSLMPHGRRAWTLVMCGEYYFDISVMPTHRDRVNVIKNQEEK